MRIYPRLVFPLLTTIDAELAHDWTLFLLELGQKSTVGRYLLQLISGRVPRKETNICGLSFPNELGVAAGFDKNARVVHGLSLLGFGHVEIGTLTPKAQQGNPKPRVFRLRSDKAIINRMGFPNEGVAAVLGYLERYSQELTKIVVGVSIGKQKETAIDQAAQDYVDIIRCTFPYADYFAVNISSPNTPGLRDLHHSEYLDDLLGVLVSENRTLAKKLELHRRPIFVKLSPDLSWEEMETVLDISMKNQIDGVIATNTTIDRYDLKGQFAPESGGLSGQPLERKSNEIIAFISRKMEGKLPIIGVGGVFDADDVREKLDLGATLVQVYTGLVYEGPGMAGRILRELYH